MAKKKLIRFKQMAQFKNVIEPKLTEVLNTNYYLKGKWASTFFKNNNPIILELGCGKGEYSVALAKKYPNKNFLGVDIKGARIWYGASEALEQNIHNVGFLRTRIDFIESFFSDSEIDEIWLTFPDPQPQESRERKRLTSPMFVNRYKKFLKPNGIVQLKTDSTELFTYTCNQISSNNYNLVQKIDDVYQHKIPDGLAILREVQTHYEKIFSNKGHIIKYVSFKIN